MSNESPHQEDRLERQVRNALDRELGSLTPQQSARLSAARAKALQAQPRPWGVWLGGAGLASAAALAAVMFWPGSQPLPNALPNGFADTLALAELDQDEVDLIEDLEFVYWLSEQTGQEASHESS